MEMSGHGRALDGRNAGLRERTQAGITGQEEECGPAGPHGHVRADPRSPGKRQCGHDRSVFGLRKVATLAQKGSRWLGALAGVLRHGLAHLRQTMLHQKTGLAGYSTCVKSPQP